MKQIFIMGLSLSGLLILTACGGPANNTATSSLTGTVKVDGSSTVFPITEAVAEEFGKIYPKVRVTVGISGTGGGFKKYVIGETDINDASRPIKGSEINRAVENGVAFIELPIAFDGLSVVVNRANTWVDQLTVAELNLIWKPGSHVQFWNDIRPEWPAKPIHLFGPGTDSGTFDYFTEAINGKAQACRSDFSKSEDDNVLVRGIAGDPYALGFFGFAYYQENTDQLKVIPIDGGAGPVAPSVTTINDGSYQPLSRPIFIYVRPASAKREEVRTFVNFYLDHAPALVGEVGYVALPAEAYDHDRLRFNGMKTGSLFSGKETIGLKIEDILKAG